jgi:IS4 transposase
MYEGKSERGVIVGIKLRLVEDDEEDNVINKLYPALQKIDNDKENEIIKLKQKIIELEQHIFDLYKIEPFENIIVEEEQEINVEKIVDIEPVKQKKEKKDKKDKKQKTKKDIVEIKPQEINLDEVFENPLFKKYF